MALLTNEQKNILAQLQSAKLDYDAKTAALTEAAAQQKEENKGEIRNLVGVALAANIPMRQIHLNGLGLGQVKQMEAFLAPRIAGGVVGQLKAVLRAADEWNIANLVTPREPAVPKVRHEGNDAYWMEEGVEQHAGILTINSKHGSISPFKFGKLSPVGQAAILGSTDKIILVGPDETGPYFADGTLPERYNTL